MLFALVINEDAESAAAGLGIPSSNLRAKDVFGERQEAGFTIHSFWKSILGGGKRCKTPLRLFVIGQLVHVRGYEILLRSHLGVKRFGDDVVELMVARHVGVAD
jgi:hypothetical protein